MKAADDDMSNEKAQPAAEALTQFCPQCDYDLFGLPEDRCPECGTAFDRKTLPFRLRGVPKARSGLNWLLVVSVIMAMIKFSEGRSGLNTALQLGWIGAFLGCAIVWAWLRRAEWYYGSRPHLLLWLLLPCLAVANREDLPKGVQTGLEVFKSLSGIAILLFTLLRSPRIAASYLMTAFGLGLAVVGAIVLVLALAFYSFGVEAGTYTAFGSRYPAKGANHLFAAAISLSGGVLGLVILYVSRRLRKRP